VDKNVKTINNENDKQFINIMHIIKNLFRFSYASNNDIFILRIYYYKRLFNLLEVQ
jgi:hypothetical protein